MLTSTTHCEWRLSPGPVGYEAAVREMEERAQAVRLGEADDLVWLLEHPPVYTAGTSASPDELLTPLRFPVHRTGRGGRYTYHGPGQRVVYVVRDIGRRDRDLRRHVWRLEELVIRSLALLGIEGQRRDGRIGIWVAAPGRPEAKIAAIGVRVRHWVTFHGVAINVDPDLEHFSGIVPCGLAGFAVTSVRDQGRAASLGDLDAAIRRTFPLVFED
jgi:lipoyl(octanoyl) transferase